ncbi:hypothetical protein [Bradyrhizobium sp. USDA 4508]
MTLRQQCQKPGHLFVACDGDMFDTRRSDWSRQRPLRPGYSRSHREIRSVADLKATLRAGAYAWPGGYPMYLLCSDGAALCFQCARKNARSIYESIGERLNDGWRVVGCDINYEDNSLFCEDCSQQIESAHGDDGH